MAMQQSKPHGKFARTSSLWDLDKTAHLGDNHALLSRRLACRPGEERDAALLIAARRGAAEVARKLAESGANPNVKGERGRTALHLATLSGNVDCVRAILEQGADKRIKDDAKASAAHLARAIGKHRIASIIESWSSPYDDEVFGLGDAHPPAEPSAALATCNQIKLLESCLEQKKAALPDHHEGIARTMDKLGREYFAINRIEDAAKIQEEACELASDPDRLFRLAKYSMACRKPLVAVNACRKALDMISTDISADYTIQRDLLQALAASFGGAQNYEGQLEAYQTSISFIEAHVKDNMHPSLVRPFVGLGHANCRLKDPVKGAAAFARALQIADAHLSPNHPDIAKVMRDFADALTDAYEFEKAQALYRRIMEIEQANGLDTRATHDQMASCIVRHHKFMKHRLKQVRKK